jgi:hypothetical protein|tara:strand:- start:1940 stop:2209 length:270 start_codon:yes stop_codon:yes gene_type:complete
MSNILQLLGTEVACGDSSGSASNFGGRSLVRLINTTTSDHLVTLEAAGGVDTGTLTLTAKGVVILKKLPTEKIFAANVGVKGVAIGYAN